MAKYWSQAINTVVNTDAATNRCKKKPDAMHHRAKAVFVEDALAMSGAQLVVVVVTFSLIVDGISMVVEAGVG